MTCYQRHLGPLFDELGLAYEKKDRARLDAALRKVFGLGDEAHCPQVWAAIKALSDDELGAFPARVSELL